MNAIQRRKDLSRLSYYRRKHGFSIGPEIGWVECIANMVRVRDGLVDSGGVQKEAKLLGLEKLDSGLVADVVKDISAKAWGKYPLYTTRMAGNKLEVTSVEREEAGILKIDAVDEPRKERQRRLDRERKAEKRAAEAAPKRLTKKAIADTLGISRPTLNKWIAEGKIDQEFISL